MEANKILLAGSKAGSVAIVKEVCTLPNNCYRDQIPYDKPTFLVYCALSLDFILCFEKSVPNVELTT
jgi:hypothetical protein